MKPSAWLVFSVGLAALWGLSWAIERWWRGREVRRAVKQWRQL